MFIEYDSALGLRTKALMYLFASFFTRRRKCFVVYVVVLYV